MNWFVNENTCFPPLASIYAFYRVHLAPLSTPPFPSLFPTLSLSRSILHSPSFLPPRRILLPPPPLSLTRVYPSPPLATVPAVPSLSRSVSVPDVCDCQCLPRTYYRDDVAALWRSAEGKGGGGGRAKNRGNLRSKLFASGPMRISERIIIIPGIRVLRAWTNE